MNKSSHPVVIRDIPEHPGYALKVYGFVKAKGLTEEMAQGYTVLVNGQPTPRVDLPEPVQKEVRRLLEAEYPEHALI